MMHRLGRDDELIHAGQPAPPCPALHLRGRVLLDVDNVALGHAARMRWNPADKRLFSEQC
jgi:hypothetical protein